MTSALFAQTAQSVQTSCKVSWWSHLRGSDWRTSCRLNFDVMSRTTLRSVPLRSELHISSPQFGSDPWEGAGR